MKRPYMSNECPNLIAYCYSYAKRFKSVEKIRAEVGCFY